MPERLFMPIVTDPLDQVEGVSAPLSERFDLKV